MQESSAVNRAGMRDAEHRVIASPRSRLKQLDAALPIGIKLALPLLAIAVIGGAILTLTVYRSEADRIRRDYESRAFLISQDVRGALAAQRIADKPLAGASTGLQRHIDTLVELEPSILRIDLYDMSGRSPSVVASSDHARIGLADEEPAADEQEASRSHGMVSHEEQIDSRSTLHVTVPFQAQGQAPFLVAIYLSTAERDRELTSLLRNFALGFGASLVLAVIALVVGVRVLILGRIARVLAAADRMQSGDFSARVENVPEREPRDEMLRLASRFNGMAASIQQLHAQVEEAATTDQLTGLYNRRFAIDVLNREIARARREGSPLSVIMVDLDGLKEVNDRHGHVAGDHAIRQAAASLRAVLRAGDYAARIGGDEFVAVLPGCGPEMLAVVLARLQQAAQDTGAGAEGSTVSTGGAVLQDADGADSLLQRADVALYEAKRAGKNQSRIAA
jgi:diguanylate cyclase (GGDEF)-like protein